MERKYIVQRIEWVTTGWKGPCLLKDKKKCEMKNAEDFRAKSKNKGRTKCIGCTEAEAFKKWKWEFSPSNCAPNPNELKKGDIILVISRYLESNIDYHLVGVGVVENYYKEKSKNIFENRVYCNPDLSVAFTFPNGHVKYPKNYSKHGRASFKYIKENQAIKLLELAKEQHEKINKPEIAKRIEKLIEFIKNTPEKDYQNLEGIKKILNAINTKPFIILSGISGTGKTQIARLISAGIVKFKGG